MTWYQYWRHIITKSSLRCARTFWFPEFCRDILTIVLVQVMNTMWRRFLKLEFNCFTHFYQIFFLLFLRCSFLSSQIQLCKFFHEKRFLSHPIFFQRLTFDVAESLLTFASKSHQHTFCPTHKLYVNTRLAQAWQPGFAAWCEESLQVRGALEPKVKRRICFGSLSSLCVWWRRLSLFWWRRFGFCNVNKFVFLVPLSTKFIIRNSDFLVGVVGHRQCTRDERNNSV